MNNKSNESAPVITIERGRAAAPEPEKSDSFIRDMGQSYTRNKILCDRVCGVEKVNGEFFMVIYHGPYKIRIPFEKSGIKLPDSASTNYSRKELIRRIFEGRLGSDVEYKVSDFMIGESVAYGDREYAMKQRSISLRKKKCA